MKKPQKERIIKRKKQFLLKLPLFIGLLFVILVSGGVGFMLHTDKKGAMYPETNTTNQYASSTPGTYDTTLEKQGEIVPVETANGILQKEKVESDEYHCGVTPGIISYYPVNHSDASYLVIYPKNLATSTEDRQSLSNITDFLGGKHYEQNSSLADILGIFRIGCGGSASFYIEDLPSLSYAGTTTSRTILAMSGQSPFGQMHVMIFAEKNNNLLWLSKILDDNSLYAKYNNSCKDDYVCYRNELYNDPVMKDLAKKEAEKLLHTYRLE